MGRPSYPPGRSRSAVRSLSPNSLASRQRGSSATQLDDRVLKEQLAVLPKVKVSA